MAVDWGSGIDVVLRSGAVFVRMVMAAMASTFESGSLS